MPSVHKKRALNRVTFETRKIEEKRPTLSTGTSKEQLPRLVRTQIRKGQLPGLLIGGTLYWRNPESKRASSRACSHTRYWEDPESKRASSRTSSHTHYWEDPESKRASSRASSHTRYWEDPESKRASSRASSHTRYWEDPESKRGIFLCVFPYTLLGRP